MGLFDSIQNILGGVTDSVSGSVGDAVGGLTDNLPLQDITDQVSQTTADATDAISSVTEQGQTIIDDLSQNFK